ncbi:hypothetical protein RUND412_011014 [Rhizina undulata]
MGQDHGQTPATSTVDVAAHSGSSSIEGERLPMAQHGNCIRRRNLLSIKQRHRRSFRHLPHRQIHFQGHQSSQKRASKPKTKKAQKEAAKKETEKAERRTPRQSKLVFARVGATDARLRQKSQASTTNHMNERLLMPSPYKRLAAPDTTSGCPKIEK